MTLLIPKHMFSSHMLYYQIREVSMIILLVVRVYRDKIILTCNPYISG